VPFRSEKQRKFLYAKHPEIAKRWQKEYGDTIVAKKLKRNPASSNDSKYKTPGETENFTFLSGSNERFMGSDIKRGEHAEVDEMEQQRRDRYIDIQKNPKVKERYQQEFENEWSRWHTGKDEHNIKPRYNLDQVGNKYSEERLTDEELDAVREQTQKQKKLQNKKKGTILTEGKK